jgi:futalosine hydrolase
MSVLVVAATPLEAARLETGRATLVVTGMGAVNTAHGLTRQLVAPPKPSLVIQMGIAGAYMGAGLSVGSAVLASEEMYGDVGVMTPKGWFPAEEIGIPLVAGTATQPARFNRFPFDEGLVARASAIGGPLLARTGRFLTLAQGTGVRALGDSLYERFGALCESMEGAAAAHLCALYDVPFLEVRGISNLVEDRDRSAWRITEAVEAAQAVVSRLLEEIDRLLELPDKI